MPVLFLECDVIRAVCGRKTTQAAAFISPVASKEPCLFGKIQVVPLLGVAKQVVLRALGVVRVARCPRHGRRLIFVAGARFPR